MTHFIVSVGTSIITNFEKKQRQIISNNINEPTINGAFNKFGQIFCTFPEPNRFLNNGTYDTLVKFYKDIKNQGAEQKSIETIISKKNFNRNNLTFHLIVTSTEESKFCASFLGHQVLQGAKIKYYIPQGLDKPDDEDFSEIGLPNLLSCIAFILNEINGSSEEAIIIPTGGYKAIIPYLTIASILYDKPAYYIYEDSNTLLELPSPPLGVNTKEFMPANVLLENIKGLSVIDAKPYYEGLHERFQKLVYPGENNLYKLTAFGERLQKIYSEQTGISPFVIRAIGNTLMKKLGSDYKEQFAKLVGLGETIWLGDKAPEMAEHARYHHSNLFAYSELLLLPIFSRIPEFLSKEELFLLLGIVYLHDCGHSSSSIVFNSGDKQDRIPLLPTEIRNFHNILGYQRLMSPKFQEIIRTQVSELKNEFFSIVAGLSAYHRKKMPILLGTYYGPDLKGEENKENKELEFGSLTNKTVSFQGKEIVGDRLSLLVSLFRIIDGMDKQVTRNGDAVEVSMKAEAILADLDNLWGRACLLEDALEKLDSNLKKKVDNIFNIIINEYGDKEGTGTACQNDSVKKCGGWTDECNNHNHSPEGGKEIASYLELKKFVKDEHLAFAWEYLYARTRFFFQAIQPVYYHSDLLLGMPKVTHSNNDETKVIINYDENTITEGKRKVESIWDEIKAWFKKNLNGKPECKKVTEEFCLKTPKQVVEGIRDEYCSMKKTKKENGDEYKYNTAVAQILKKNNIVVEFRFKGESVSCCRS